ncbi:MAG: NADH-quinone oxidoreductase subunit C [Candidatus Bathyarchaeota archaeon]|nr:NADH-quinone oxidoreductase subunit C [Candidatus Bathyarchaeota archaeon]
MSKNNINDFISSVQKTLAEEIESVEQTNDNYVSMVVKPDSFVKVAEMLRDKFGYVIPVAAGGVDYPDENRMQMIYYLVNPKTRFTLTYRVNVSRDDPRLPTLTTVWDGMSFHEREAYEMFGIDFEGHENLVPLLLPPTWKGGYPLRKDFKGEGVE